MSDIINIGPTPLFIDSDTEHAKTLYNSAGHTISYSATNGGATQGSIAVGGSYLPTVGKWYSSALTAIMVIVYDQDIATQVELEAAVAEIEEGGDIQAVLNQIEVDGGGTCRIGPGSFSAPASGFQVPS